LWCLIQARCLCMAQESLFSRQAPVTGILLFHTVSARRGASTNKVQVIAAKILPLGYKDEILCSCMQVARSVPRPSGQPAGQVGRRPAARNPAQRQTPAVPKTGQGSAVRQRPSATVPQQPKASVSSPCSVTSVCQQSGKQRAWTVVTKMER
jgi:hypothetical protein